MPSPFPGMDPYIEGELWIPFHNELAVVIAHMLNPQLKPRYVARTEKKYVVPQVSVVIRDAGRRQLVTAIEFLSPTNKVGQGRQKYLRKRARILRSPVHLLEIDLNRTGERLPAKGKLPTAPYYVFLTRTQRRPIMNVWPIPLDQPLPTIPVPLLAPDPDVSLDLQEAMNQVYDRGNYDLEIDYAQAPELPLPTAARTWAYELLQKAGKRGGAAP